MEYTLKASLIFCIEDEEREFLVKYHDVKFLSIPIIWIFFFKIFNHKTKSSLVFCFGNLKLLVKIFFSATTVDRPDGPQSCLKQDNPNPLALIL